ncbi:MAG TPA: hypothetical protein VMF90_20180 [Rhizobiaceae bacterium]|nr:hypothetical protein [Rhizobiaceae bacterium]
MLFVENTLGGDISVIDETQLKEVSRIDLGDVQPDDVASSPDGETIYCNAVIPDGHPHYGAWKDSVVVAIDVATLSERWRVHLPNHVGHMAISPDGRHLYVALFETFHVAEIDVETRAVSYIPVMFSGGHGIRVSADGRRLYVGSILMSRLDLVDLEKRSVVRSYHFPENVRPFHFNADESLLYVQNTRMHGFHVVDAATATILRTISLPALAPGTPTIDQYPHTVDHGLEVTPDGKLLLAAATTGGYLAAYSLPDLTLKATIPLGDEPYWVTISASGERAYVSNRNSDDISAIDLGSLKEIARIPVGRLPQRMTVARSLAA